MAMIMSTACGMALAQGERNPVPKPPAQNPAVRAPAAEQIKALAEEKASRTPAQKKMDSRLVLALKKSRSEPPFDRHPDLPAGLDVRPDGRVLVDLDATVTPELLKAAALNGGEVVSHFPKMRAVRAFVPLAQTEVLAARDDVRSIAPAEQPVVNPAGNKSTGAATGNSGSATRTEPRR